MSLEQWGLALQGFGAGVQGQGPQFQVALNDRLKTLSELDTKRQEAMVKDIRSMRMYLDAGDRAGAMNIAQSRLDAISKLGGDPSHTAEITRLLSEGKDDEARARLQRAEEIAVANGMLPSMDTGNAEDPSNVREYMFWQSLPLEQQEQYLQVKRAQQVIDMGGGVSGTVRGNQATPITQMPGQTIGQVRADIAGAEANLEGATSAAGEYGKLGAQLQVAPAIESATTTAELNAQAAIKPQMEADTARQVEKARAEILDATRKKDEARLFAAYDEARKNVVSSFSSTPFTGPVAGRVPAVTTGSQTADGNVKVYGYAIKGMIRSKGEGNWSDADQAYMQSMLPSRADTPEAAEAKMEAIDAWVRVKLGQPAAGKGASGTGSPAGAEPSGVVDWNDL